MKIAIVDDEKFFCQSMGLEFREDGFEASEFYDIPTFLKDISVFDKIILDLKIGIDNSINFVKEVRTKYPESRIIILTGFGSIGSTVEAIKNGADDYLLKPISYKDLKSRLFDENISYLVEEMSLDRKEREYIEFILLSCEGNISKAAKKLGIHRQSLQRKLKKYTPN